MKKKLLIPSLALVAFLSSCNYGGVIVVSNKEFKQFYDRGDLATQKTHNFAIGEDLIISKDSFLSENESESIYFSLSSSSISSWEGEKKYGNKLEFTQSEIETIGEDTISYLFNYGSLAYTSYNVIEPAIEEDEEDVITGKKESYTFSKTYVSGDTENINTSDEYHSIELSKSSVDTFETIDGGQTFDEDPSSNVKTYSYTTKDKTIVENGEKTERTITEQSFSETIQYTENYLGDNVKKALVYSYNSTTKVTTEKKVSGFYEGYTRVDDITVRTTTYDESSQIEANREPQGKETISHNEYIYSTEDYQYHKDTEHSTSTEDTTYRYSLSDDFVEQFTADNLVLTFKTDVQLNTVFFTSLNLFVQQLFIQFESRMSDTSIGEEILKNSDSYQYRAKISNSTVEQYSFIKDKDKHDTMSSFIEFDVNGLELKEKTKISLIY